MHETIYRYFLEIRYVKTKGCQRLMDLLEFIIQHPAGEKRVSAYRAVADKRGEKYNTFAKSIARTTEAVWKRDDRISKGSTAPAPSPRWVLGKLIFLITGEAYL